MKPEGTINDRGYYRVSDKVRLTWIPAGKDSSAGVKESELNEINKQLSGLINTVFSENPVAGEALGLLNRKLELLHEVHSHNGGIMKLVPISLSVSGIGFLWDQPAAEKQVITVSLLLQPSNTLVKIDVFVHECSQGNNKEFPYRIRGEFDPLQEFEIEQIAKHVAFKQTQMLAERRDREDNY